MYRKRYSPRRIAVLILGIFVFILAIQLMREGASAFTFLLQGRENLTPANTLGFGWLFSYLVLGGGPVAASAITLLEGGVLNEISTFMMINGSRLGASFVVLAIGLVYLLRGREMKVSISIGLLAFLATATIYSIGIAIGYVMLASGLFDFLEISAVVGVKSVLEVVYAPILGLIPPSSPDLLLFGAGLIALLISFKLFDGGMPQIRPGSVGKGRWKDGLYNKNVMFLIGGLVTLVTMSVSVSLSLLVPLSVRGNLNHEKSLPYIMGANMTTFIDTFFVAILVGSAVGLKIMIIEIISIGIPTFIILGLVYGRYEALNLRLLHLFNN
ncbi:MAG: hypothetical protein V3T23_09210, partial [Nitrososphaerales archaeon]